MDTVQSRLRRRQMKLPNGCWHLRGIRGSCVAGRPSIGVKIDGVRRVLNVTKVLDLLGLVKGDGPVIRHRCDDRSCWRPTHLVKGTVQDNANDKVRANRQHHPTGELNGRVKLSNAQVTDIRRRYRETNVTQKTLAEEYGVSQARISKLTLNTSRRIVVIAHHGTP